MTPTKQPVSGRFIVFEGIGGSGKSSALEAAAQILTAHGYTVVATRQPGGTAVGRKIRELVLDPAYKSELDATAQLFLYAADRYAHIEGVIRPALAAGHIVLCDRYDHSTRAYQAAGGGDPAKLEIVNDLATGGLRPHRTYWFDVDPVTARERTRAANRPELDRFDLEAQAFWQRLQEAYARQAAQRPAEIKRIDAGRPHADVIQEVTSDLLRLVSAGTE